MPDSVLSILRPRCTLVRAITLADGSVDVGRCTNRGDLQEIGDQKLCRDCVEDRNRAIADHPAARSRNVSTCPGTLEENRMSGCRFGCKVHRCTYCKYEVVIHPWSYGHAQTYWEVLDA